MLDIGWQTTAALLCVFGAAAFMLLRLKRFVCGSGVGGCGDCPRASAVDAAESGTHLITEDQISLPVLDDPQD